MGSPELRSRDQGGAVGRRPAAGVLHLFLGASSRRSALLLLWYYWSMEAEQFEMLNLLISSVMPLGILTIVVLAVILFGITTATESAADRRRRCVPARAPGRHAQLEAHQGSGVPDRQDHRHGVLAVRRLGAVLGGVRDPRRPGAGREMGAVART